MPEDIAVRVPQEAMRGTVEDIFQALGMPKADARQAADVLIWADLRGCESHGVSNMMRPYVAWLRSGAINPKPEWRISRDSRAVVTIDCDKGLGLVVGPRAMDVAIERARDYGVATVVADNGGHYGAAGYHAYMALEHDMIGLSMTAGGLGVTPTWGAEAMVGLNPIGFAAPAGEEPPFVFDASMSSVAGNKLQLARRLGVPTFPAWIATMDGAPVMEQSPIPAEFLILPVGGTREIGSHKGYGLALMVEVLTSLISGGHGGPFRSRPLAHYFQAYNVDAFTDVAEFKARMDASTSAPSGTAPRRLVTTAWSTQVSWRTRRSRRVWCGASRTT
ncbi:MAG TPA: Ldh family oxidoreductase, partial [Tepidiformaceae bacterium]|nr:Ldh family oxidoreductase [Tepidiformaceae bacterium]